MHHTHLLYSLQSLRNLAKNGRINPAVAKVLGLLGICIIGGLVMAVMSNGMQLQGVQVPTQQIVKGLVLLLAVAFDVWNKRRAAAAKS